MEEAPRSLERGAFWFLGRLNREGDFRERVLIVAAHRENEPFSAAALK
jgi:hypothetical protein